MRGPKGLAEGTQNGTAYGPSPLPCHSSGPGPLLLSSQHGRDRICCQEFVGGAAKVLSVGPGFEASRREAPHHLAQAASAPAPRLDSRRPPCRPSSVHLLTLCPPRGIPLRLHRALSSLFDHCPGRYQSLTCVTVICQGAHRGRDAEQADSTSPGPSLGLVQVSIRVQVADLNSPLTVLTTLCGLCFSLSSTQAETYPVTKGGEKFCM